VRKESNMPGLLQLSMKILDAKEGQKRRKRTEAKPNDLAMRWRDVLMDGEVEPQRRRTQT